MIDYIARGESINHGVGLVSWRWRTDPIAAMEQTIPDLVDTRPQLVVVHGSPRQLLDEGRQAAEMARRALPGVRVYLEVAGDVMGQVDLWPVLPTLCQAAGADSLVINAEPRWYGEAKLAAKAVRELRETRDLVAPAVTLGHTSFGWPAHVKLGGRGYGGHPKYPWAEFCGADGLDYTVPQVYWGGEGDGVAERRRGRWAEAAELSWAEAERLGWHREGIPYGVYLQAYRCHRADLCHVGQAFPLVLWWSAHRIEPHGRDAMRALAELRRRGYVGGDAIRRFQEAASISVDGLVGPQTLGALGLK